MPAAGERWSDTGNAQSTALAATTAPASAVFLQNVSMAFPPFLSWEAKLSVRKNFRMLNVSMRSFSRSRFKSTRLKRIAATKRPVPQSAGAAKYAFLDAQPP
jgi:hypothetical protein